MYFEAWYNKGSALYELKRFKEAVECLDKATKMNPRDADAWYSEGAALAELGKSQEALKCYDEALRIDPSYQDATDAKNKLLEKE